MSQCLLKSIRWSVALSLAFTLALLLTLSAQAQDEPPPPDAPAAPATIPTPPSSTAEWQPEVGAESAAEAPMATSDLEIAAVDTTWFFCTSDTVDGLVDGKCTYTGGASLTNAIANFTTHGGSGLITSGNGIYTGNQHISAIPLLTGLVSENGSEVTRINELLEIDDLSSAFTLRGFTIGFGTDSINPLLWIHDNTGTFTLSDVVVSDNNMGPGLRLEGQTGSVSLDRVQADHNRSTAVLYYSAKILASGNITISNSSFDDNLRGATVDYGHALWLDAPGGNITLNGVSASNNALGNGVFIQQDAGRLLVQNSVFSKNQDGNLTNAYGFGLSVYSYSLPVSNAAVTIDHVIASDNELSGIFIQWFSKSVVIRNSRLYGNDNYGIYVDTCKDFGAGCLIANAGVSIYNTEANLNAYNGVSLVTSGNILLDGVNAAQNTSINTSLQNDSNAAARTVSVLRSRFDGSSISNGIYIASKGAVTLNGVSASGNGAFGAYIINLNGTAAVNILGTLGQNIFSSNQENGLTIRTKGAVTIKNALVENNTYTGIDLNDSANIGAVKIEQVSASNNGAASGTGSGFKINNRGSITLTSVTASYNDGYGAWLDNTWAPAGSAPGVTVTNSTFSGNGDTSESGLQVTSRGAVKLTNVNAEWNNFGSGIKITNSSGTAGVTLTTSSGGRNMLNNNFAYGIRIESSGALSISGVTANDNAAGASLINILGTAGVTIKDLVASDNNDLGLEVISKGAISITGIIADRNNTASGITAVWLDNCGWNFTLCNLAYPVKPITIKPLGSQRNSISENGKGGLWVYSNGAITVQNLDMHDNTDTDTITQGNARLYNWEGSAVVKVTNSTFYNNGYSGMMIMAGGSVTLNQITASDNGIPPYQYVGLFIRSRTASAGINAQNITANYNLNENIDLGALGIIYVNHVQANDSVGATGLNIDYFGADKPNKITLYNIEANGNNEHGIRAISDGLITAAGLHCGSNDPIYAPNGMSGITLDNSAGTAGVTISGAYGTNFAEGNVTDGLNIKTRGPVSITSFQADNNENYGIVIGEYNSLVTPTTVTLNKVTTNWNTDINIRVYARGNIALTSVEAGGSYDEAGVVLNACSPVAAVCSGSGTVKVTSGTFNQNQFAGIDISANNNVTLSKITALYSREGLGILIDTTRNLTATVNVSKITVVSNAEYGMYILSKGAVVLNAIDASSGMSSGVLINNRQGASTAPVTLLATLGANHFDLNQGIGLNVQSYGAVSLNSYSASRNTVDGVYVLTDAAATVNAGVMEYNGHHGLAVEAGGDITINSSYTVSNGGTSDYSGMNLWTSGTKMAVNNSVSINNSQYGIFAFFASSGTLYVHNPLYFGNDRLGGTADDNIEFVNGSLVFN